MARPSVSPGAAGRPAVGRAQGEGLDQGADGHPDEGERAGQGGEEEGGRQMRLVRVEQKYQCIKYRSGWLNKCEGDKKKSGSVQRYWQSSMSL